MVSEAEIERLRLEADTILTRYGTVDRALERARQEEGDHWDERELELRLETPTGEAIDVTVGLQATPEECAGRRYDRATRLESELERRRSVDARLSALPADPLAYLVAYHLDAVEGNYPRSMAGHLDAERGHVETLCEGMETAGVLERVESGTVKQRRVKAKQADEVRQHHTYYRLSRQGDHLLRFLSEREGKRNVLRHLPAAERIARRLAREGPDSPRGTAADLEVAFEEARHHYRTLQRVGLVVTADGSDRRSDDDGRHTYYATTAVAETLLAAVED
jgi:predicted transcriptional regulator